MCATPMATDCSSIGTCDDALVVRRGTCVSPSERSSVLGRLLSYLGTMRLCP